MSSVRRGVLGAALLLATALPAMAAQTGPGYALHFDGVSGFVKVQNFLNSAPTGEVTVEFWQKVSSIRPQSTFRQSPPPAGTSAPDSSFNGHVPFSDGRVYWDFGNIANGGRLSYQPPVQITGTWQHFAFVASQSGNYMAIYRNGILEAIKSGMTPLVHSNLDLQLSGVPSGLAFDGSLDEFRIWNVARAVDQIQNNLYHSLTGNEPGLVLYYRFNEGSGNIANDETGSAAGFGTIEGGVAWEHSTAPFVPDVSTLAGSISQIPGGPPGAVFRAWVNPDGLPTSVSFQWGTGPNVSNTTTPIDIGAGTTPLLVSATVNDLAPGVKYVFRPVAQNLGGPVFGEYQFLMAPISIINHSIVTNAYDDPDDPESLPYLIAHALPGTKIVFPPLLTGVLPLTNGPLPISTNNFAIEGNCNVILDGLGTNRAFVPITNTVHITGITFSNCAAVNGGAIVVSSGGVLTLSNCTFVGNNASGTGGAVAVNSGGTLQLDGCTLVRNHAADGGGIDTLGDVSLNNCTIVSNTASATGGGLRLETGTGSLAVNSCTIVGNTAANGGGIEDDDGGGSLSARNSIIAHNSVGGGGPDVRTFVAGFSSSGYNLVSRTNGSSGWRRSGLSDDDHCGSTLAPLYPLLARLDTNGGCTCTMALLPGSPAIDTGSSGGLANDQRGLTRPTNILGVLSPPDDAGDIGAFEVQTSDLTNAPVLTIFSAGTNAILLWDSKAKAYTLEQTSPLNPPAAWTPVATSPALTNGNAELTVTRPASDTNKFFRLRAP